MKGEFRWWCDEEVVSPPHHRVQSAAVLVHLLQIVFLPFFTCVSFSVFSGADYVSVFFVLLFVFYSSSWVFWYCSFLCLFCVVVVMVRRISFR
jgi:hypothetical protein